MSLLNNITVFDFETTGLSPREERVVEMAALRIRNGVVIGSFQTLVHQTREIHPKAKEAHGIQESDLEHAMDEAMAFDILLSIMGDSTIVAHNATFDLGFLHDGFQRLFGHTVQNNFIDTLTIARDRFTYPHTLESVCGKLGISLDGAHRALNDVYGCFEILKAMHESEPVDQYVNVLGYLRKFGPPKWSPAYARLIPMENRYDPKGGAAG